MRVQITGIERNILAEYIKHHYPEIQVVRKNPDFILCYGGDGTLLFAEREFPGIPKVMIRHSRICKECARRNRDTVLRLLVSGKYILEEYPLLEATIRRHRLFGLNDIIIGHATINTSLRFNVFLNGEQYGGQYIGDGVIISTPLGSSGYYQSVTNSTFQSGLGIAFNNTVNIIGHLVVSNDFTVRVQVNRGPGVVVADNDNRFITIDRGQNVDIRRSERITHVVYFKDKQYHQYNVGLGENRVPLGFCQICSKPIE